MNTKKWDIRGKSVFIGRLHSSYVRVLCKELVQNAKMAARKELR